MAMYFQWVLVHVIVWFSVSGYGFPNLVNSASETNQSHSSTPLKWLLSPLMKKRSSTLLVNQLNVTTEPTMLLKESALPKESKLLPKTDSFETIRKTPTLSTPLFSKLTLDPDTSLADITWPILGEPFEGRGKKKNKMMMMTKLLMGIKIVLLGIVLPMGVLFAKAMSWKAVTLSLLAFMLAKIVFVKNTLMNKIHPSPSPSTAPSAPPVAPIIIHSSSPHGGHEPVWKKSGHSRIHLQPEVHVHQSDPTPAWSWAEEGRGGTSDPHQLAFGAWLSKHS